MVTLQCQVCDSSFEVKPYRASKAKYCSRACRQRAQVGVPKEAHKGRVKVKCATCSTEFEVESYRKDTAKFCSKPCQSQSFLNTDTRVCKFCQREYPVSKALHGGSNAGLLFCSRDCRHRAAKKRIVVRCRNCAKQMRVLATQVDRGRGKFCSKRCMRQRKAYLISIGKAPMPAQSRSKMGYYTSTVTGERNQYDSSYELARMLELDNKEIPWTKNHGIVIHYRYAGGDYYYVPDLKVGDTSIEEIKSSWKRFDSKTIAKAKAAEVWCARNGYTYTILTEDDLCLDLVANLQ